METEGINCLYVHSGEGKTKERLGLSAVLKSEHTQCFIGHSLSGNAFEKE